MWRYTSESSRRSSTFKLRKQIPEKPGLASVVLPTQLMVQSPAGGLSVHRDKRPWLASSARNLKVTVHQGLTEHPTDIITHHIHSHKELKSAPFYFKGITE